MCIPKAGLPSRRKDRRHHGTVGANLDAKTFAISENYFSGVKLAVKVKCNHDVIGV